jgi:hypothetical protein
MSSDFSILDYLNLLTPSGESKTKYLCPICGGNDLDISGQGKYSCFSGGCDSKAIASEILTLAGSPPKNPNKTQQWTFVGEPIEYLYQARDGSSLAKVIRQNKVDQDGNRGKNFYQKIFTNGRWVNPNEEPELKGQIPIYRYAEVTKAIANGQQIFVVEGEQVADALWAVGIAATTTIGGSGGYSKYGGYRQDLAGARVVLGPDREAVGLKYIANFERDFSGQIDGYCLAGEIEGWSNPRDGRDLADDLRDRHLSKDLILKSIISVGQFEAIATKALAQQDESAIEDDTALLREAIAAATTTLSGSQLTAKLAAIAKQFSQSPVTVEKISFQIQEETDSASDERKDVKRLLSSSSYDPLSAIAEPLREKIRREATRWSLPPLVYLSVLLPMVLSLCKTDTVLKARETSGKPILWTCLVGTSNSGKSESSGTIIAPLESLQGNATDDFELKLAAFNQEKKLAEEARKVPSSKRSDEQKELVDKFVDAEPPCREYFLTDYTHEVVGKVLKPQKENGLLIYMDELKPFFCFDRYTSGSGNRARTLQWYDGKGIKINRKGQERIHLSKTAISLVGTTQPSTLEALLKDDPNMEDGLWARLVLIYCPTTPTYSHDSDDSDDLAVHLKRVCADILQNSAITFDLTSEGKQVWAKWYDSAVDAAIGQNSDFLASIYGKAKDRAARVALALHVLNAAVTRQTLSPEVSANTLEHAIAINRIFLHNTEKCLGLIGVTTTQEESRVLKFVTKFEGSDWVDTDRVKSWWTTKPKPLRQTCRDFMDSIVSQGFAESNGLEKTDPKYKIKILHPKKRSPSSPDGPEPIAEDGCSLDLVPSLGLVRSSPENRSSDRTADYRTTTDYPQTSHLVRPKNHTGSRIQPEQTTRTTDLDFEILDEV